MSNSKRGELYVPYLSILLTLNGQFNCNPNISYLLTLAPYLLLFSTVSVIQIHGEDLICSTKTSQGVEELQAVFLIPWHWRAKQTADVSRL